MTVEEIKKNADKVAAALGYNIKSIDLDVINVKDAYCIGFSHGHREDAIEFGTWIQKNCLVSRNGFRLLPSLKEEISNEKAYELYLESFKSKV